MFAGLEIRQVPDDKDKEHFESESPTVPTATPPSGATPLGGGGLFAGLSTKAPAVASSPSLSLPAPDPQPVAKAGLFSGLSPKQLPLPLFPAPAPSEKPLSLLSPDTLLSTGPSSSSTSATVSPSPSPSPSTDPSDSLDTLPPADPSFLPSLSLLSPSSTSLPTPTLGSTPVLVENILPSAFASPPAAAKPSGRPKKIRGGAVRPGYAVADHQKPVDSKAAPLPSLSPASAPGAAPFTIPTTVMESSVLLSAAAASQSTAVIDSSQSSVALSTSAPVTTPSIPVQPPSPTRSSAPASAPAPGDAEHQHENHADEGRLQASHHDQTDSPDLPEVEPFPLDIVQGLNAPEVSAFSSPAAPGETPVEDPVSPPSPSPLPPFSSEPAAVTPVSEIPRSHEALSTPSPRKAARSRRRRENPSSQQQQPSPSKDSSSSSSSVSSGRPHATPTKQESINAAVALREALPDQAHILRLSATPIPQNSLGKEFKQKFDGSLTTSGQLVAERKAALDQIDGALQQLRNLEAEQCRAAEEEDFEEAYSIAQIIEDLNGDLVQFQLRLVTLGERWIDVLNERKNVSRSVITADREFIQTTIDLHSGLTGSKSDVERRIEEHYGREFSRMQLEEADIKQLTESAVVDLGVLEENEKLTRTALTKQCEELDSSFRELSRERDALSGEVEELRARLREKEQALLAREAAIKNIVVQTAELNKKFTPDFDRLALSRKTAQSNLLELDRRHKALAELKGAMSQERDQLVQQLEPVSHHLKKIETLQRSVELEKSNFRQLFKYLVHADHVRRELIAHQTVHHSDSFRLTTELSQTNEAIRSFSGQLLRVNDQVVRLSKTCAELLQQLPLLMEQKKLAAGSRNFKEAARIAHTIQEQESSLAISADDLDKSKRHLQAIQQTLSDQRQHREQLQQLMRSKELAEKRQTMGLLHKLKTTTDQVIAVAIERDLFLHAEHLASEVEAIDREIADIAHQYALPAPRDASEEPPLEEQSDLSFIAGDSTQTDLDPADLPDASDHVATIHTPHELSEEEGEEESSEDDHELSDN